MIFIDVGLFDLGGYEHMGIYRTVGSENSNCFNNIAGVGFI